MARPQITIFDATQYLVYGSSAWCRQQWLRAFHLVLKSLIGFALLAGCAGDGAPPGPADEDELEVFVSYLWDYKDPEPGDLPKDVVEGIAKGFYERLKDGYGWDGPGTAIKANNDAEVSHWSKVGENEYVDQADFGLFVGHGRDSLGFFDTWVFARDLSLDRQLVNDGTGGVWGDQDLEWITSIACKSIKDNWIDGFGGLHLLLGYNADPPPYALSKELGTQYAKNLDSMTVVQAWYKVNERNAKESRPGVIAIDRKNFRDYIWEKGTGPVLPDPGKYRNADDPKAAAERLDLRTDPDSGGSADEGLGSAAPRSRSPTAAGAAVPSAPRYRVLPPAVDEAYVRAIRKSLCRTLGRFCGPAAFAQGEGELRLVDGVAELTVSLASGGYSYIDTSTWMLPGEAPPPVLPSQAEAVAIAEQFLSAMGLDGPDASRAPDLDQVAVLDTLVDSGDGNMAIAETQSLHRIVSYSRVLPGEFRYPVEGAGGAMRVHIGAGGEVIAFFRNGWREIEPVENVAIVPAEEAAEKFLGGSFPPEMIGGPPCACEEVVIDGVRLGYLEPGAATQVSALDPFYFFDAQCVSAGRSFEVGYSVPATVGSYQSTAKDLEPGRAPAGKRGPRSLELQTTVSTGSSELSDLRLLNRR